MMNEGICGPKELVDGWQAGTYCPLQCRPRRRASDTQGSLLSRCRFCCCTLMMTVFLIISIVLSLAMVSLQAISQYQLRISVLRLTAVYLWQWARPPDITIGGLQLPTNSSGVSDSFVSNLLLWGPLTETAFSLRTQVQVQADSLTINLSLQVR